MSNISDILYLLFHNRLHIKWASWSNAGSQTQFHYETTKTAIDFATERCLWCSSWWYKSLQNNFLQESRLVKWGASFRWSSLYAALMWNSDQMTIVMTHLTVDSGMNMSVFNKIHQQNKCSSKLWPWFDFWWISKLHIWYIDYSRMILRLLLCDPSWPQMILMMIIIISIFEIVIMNSRLFFVVSKIYEYHQDWN